MTQDPHSPPLPPLSRNKGGEGSPSPIERPDIEDYTLLGETPLGRGGMGVVWRARQMSTKRTVALKVIHAYPPNETVIQDRFKREVELTARLEHPNIARVYDSGIHKGRYYYAMELIEDGQHLDDHVQTHQLNHRQILKLVRTVALGVQYAHQKGVMHRDLKPSNILITPDGQPHLVDFGLAKEIPTGQYLEKSMAELSSGGWPVGTPHYMSPEQVTGRNDLIDVRTDIYSLGVILFNLLTGRWPYPYEPSSTLYFVFKCIQEEEPTRLRKILPRIDSDVEAMLLKSLAKNPAQRYQGASEFAEDIHRWMTGLPVMARPVTTWYLLSKYVLRHRVAAVIVASLVVIIISTAFIGLYSLAKARGASQELEIRQRKFETQLEDNLDLLNRAAFSIFLQQWHDGKTQSVAAFRLLSGDSRERRAMQFLLDPKPLDQKKDSLGEEALRNEAAFWQFIFAEYHRRNGNSEQAMAAYQRCLAVQPTHHDPNDWIFGSSQAQIHALTKRE